jgi:uncharacterized protein (UPF0335 family)
METIDKSSAEQLKSLVNRLENLDAEKDATTVHMREVLDEAKSKGFNTKIIKMILKMRKLKLTELQEQEDLLEVYKKALGMVKDGI